MNRERSITTKTTITEQIVDITRYVENFDVQSAKDEQALYDILGMVKDVSTKINVIEAAHQKRIKLTQELESKLAELESDFNRFAVKNKA